MADNATFEAELSRLEELDDPLSVFDRYYNALLQQSADPVTTTRVLERATQTFVADRRYRNDPRYLRLWLAYARRCREPEDIYAFLAMQSIAADLAAYYEEYAAYLERQGDVAKAGAVLKAGVERQAQPIERLIKTFADFRKNHPETSPAVTATGGSRRQEVSAYRADLLMDGNISFEELRSKSWRKACDILKTSTTSVPVADELDEFVMGLSPVDPDELTHISVYRDNTADLRELARSLAARDEDVRPLFRNRLASSNQSTFSNQLADSKHPVIDDQQRANTLSTENSNPSINNQQSSTKTSDTLFSLEDFLTKGQLEADFKARNARLSLIPEESDAGTQVSGIVPNQMRPLVPMPVLPILIDAELRKKRQMVSVPGIIESTDNIQQRLMAMEKSIGRDGIGRNQTVASLRVATGHYFVERRLGTLVILAIDLEADLSGADLHQSALKVSSDCWEAYVLGLLKGTLGLPSLGKICRHPDAVIFSETFFPHGSLAAILNSTIEEKLLLFWTRELIATISRLHEKMIIHGGITLDHVLIRLGPLPLTSIFEPSGKGGWSDRGIALISFSNALPLEEFGGELDDSLVARYRARLGVAKLSRRISLLDVVGLFNLVSNLIEGRSLRYETLWQRDILRSLQDLIDGQSTEIVKCYGCILEAIDKVLVAESSVLPTLKSLLTRLEITLLERPPQ
jgi:hypothetical protein